MLTTIGRGPYFTFLKLKSNYLLSPDPQSRIYAEQWLELKSNEAVPNLCSSVPGSMPLLVERSQVWRGQRSPGPLGNT